MHLLLSERYVDTTGILKRILKEAVLLDLCIAHGADTIPHLRLLDEI